MRAFSLVFVRERVIKCLEGFVVNEINRGFYFISFRIFCCAFYFWIFRVGGCVVWFRIFRVSKFFGLGKGEFFL